MGRHGNRKRKRLAGQRQEVMDNFEDGNKEEKASVDGGEDEKVITTIPRNEQKVSDTMETTLPQTTKRCCDLFLPLIRPPSSKEVPRGPPGARQEAYDNGDDGDDGISDKYNHTSNHDDENSQLVQRQVLLHRLESTGYTHAAFTHVIYGAPNVQRDRAEQTLPLEPNSSCIQRERRKKHNVKHRRTIQTMRRLHSVVENISDVGLFVKRNTNAPTTLAGDDVKQIKSSSQLDDLLRGYDLISLAPGNDAAFQAVCSTATACDIITLDYTQTAGSNSSLPFRIRPADVKAAMARQAVFEIPYAPAILHAKYRKKLIYLCRDLTLACAAAGGDGPKKPRLIFSSGPRSYQDERDGGRTKDALDMALRTAGDIQNLIFTVLIHLDRKLASRVFSSNAEFAMARGLERRFGSALIQHVQFETAVSDINNKNKNNTVSVLWRGPTGKPEKPKALIMAGGIPGTKQTVSRPTSCWGKKTEDGNAETETANEDLSKKRIASGDEHKLLSQGDDDDLEGDGFIAL